MVTLDQIEGTFLVSLMTSTVISDNYYLGIILTNDTMARLISANLPSLPVVSQLFKSSVRNALALL